MSRDTVLTLLFCVATSVALLPVAWCLSLCGEPPVGSPVEPGPLSWAVTSSPPAERTSGPPVWGERGREGG